MFSFAVRKWNINQEAKIQVSVSQICPGKALQRSSNGNPLRSCQQRNFPHLKHSVARKSEGGTQIFVYSLQILAVKKSGCWSDISGSCVKNRWDSCSLLQRTFSVRSPTNLQCAVVFPGGQLVTARTRCAIKRPSIQGQCVHTIRCATAIPGPGPRS